MKELDRALDADPRNLQALQLKANIEASTQQWANAERTIGKLKATFPEQPVGYYRLGLIYQAQKKYEQALAEFETGQKKAPGSVESLTGIVNVLLAQGKTEKAIARINQAQQPSPGSVTPHLLFAELYRQQKKFPEAEEALRKAIAIDRKSAGPYWRLANLYGRGDTKGAVKTLQEGLTESPETGILLQTLAERISGNATMRRRSLSMKAF